MQYRKDIDGLRAYAVISVFLFHLGILPNGYLGVDVFFVISGFLITSIIYREAISGKFSLLNFYVRRIRRIVPLLLFTTTLSLVIGYFVMLPDDLDSLAQSVFASNFSANNILMYITSSDYWAPRNDYKPLMHTWSLGVEEQFYLLFPFLFLLFQGRKTRHIGKLLIALTIVSIAIFAFSDNTARNFYLLPYRFFEFTIGGFGAILLYNRRLPTKYTPALVYTATSLIAIILSDPLNRYNDLKIIIVTIASTLILIFGGNMPSPSYYKFAFINPVVTLVGKMSFSIYMIHQVVLAFSRYLFFEEIGFFRSVGLIGITFIVSFFTYTYIENPFRDKNRISSRALGLILVPLFLLGSFISLYIYAIGGIVKDYPALGVYKDSYQFERKLFRVTTNIHIQYNEDVRKLDTDFNTSDNVKILVVGNSFGRDVSNIWLESEVADFIQLRFFDMARAFEDTTLRSRVKEADLMVFAEYGGINRAWVSRLESAQGLELDMAKVWTFGVKDFGTHNGVHYTRLPWISDFASYSTAISPSIFARNQASKVAWGDQYVDLLDPVTVNPGEVLVFTPDGKFISPDTGHLTRDGAVFYANRIRENLYKITGSVENPTKAQSTR